KVEIASAVVASLKVSCAFELESSFVGSRKVSRSADQPGHILRNYVEDFARTFTSGYTFCIRGKCRQVLVPSIRQFVPLHAIELIRELRIFLAVFVHPLCPLLM